MSPDADRQYRPFGAKATALTASVCRLKVRTIRIRDAVLQVHRIPEAHSLWLPWRARRVERIELT